MPSMRRLWLIVSALLLGLVPHAVTQAQRVMPTALDVPDIETVLVEVPNPGHPYGVRGVGEVPIVPPLAAIANAIADATGHRFTDLPISPRRVVETLNGLS